MDPAVVDRRTTPIIEVSEADLPVRRMHIAGIEGGIDARILSKDPSGPATRLVDIPQGWGTAIAGSFTASVAVFVVRGSIRLGAETVGPMDYLTVPQARVIPGIRATEATLGLMFTDAPVRYDTLTGGVPADLRVNGYGAAEWTPLPGQPGRIIKTLRAVEDETVWIQASSGWSHRGAWHHHPSLEESFVIQGDLSLVEHIAGAPTIVRLEAGSYVSRPPRHPHGGPGSMSIEDTLTFHRISGPLETEWLEALPDDPPSGG